MNDGKLKVNILTQVLSIYCKISGTIKSKNNNVPLAPTNNFLSMQPLV